MKVYADTSFLVSLYVQDASSGRAQAWLSAHPTALPLTAFARIELRNAIAQLVFRGQLTPQESAAAWQLIEADAAQGRLQPVFVPWTAILAKAEQLTAQHSARIGVRTLDILHVASALQLGATEFVSFDLRQGDLAKTVALDWHNP